MSPVKMKPAEQLIAFLDILGFETILNSKGLVETKNILTEIYNSKVLASIFNDNVFSSIVFSDSILIYHPLNTIPSVGEKRELLKKLINMVSILQRDAIGKGILTRGGITCGELDVFPLYKEESKGSSPLNFLGRGLIEAYQLEKKACYPRVIISNNILSNPLFCFQSCKDFLRDNCQVFNQSKATVLNFGFNDYLFIDYFQNLTHDACRSIMNLIKDGLRFEGDGIRKKYIWLLHYLKLRLDAYIITEIETDNLKNDLDLIMQSLCFKTP